MMNMNIYMNNIIRENSEERCTPRRGDFNDDCVTKKSLVSALIILCALIFSCLPFMGSWEWPSSLFQREI